MATKTPITVAHGDGIGPEIMQGSGSKSLNVTTRKMLDGKAGYSASQG